MNNLTKNIQAIKETGGTVLKGRSKGNLSKVMYMKKENAFCRVNGKIMPVEEFYKPFKREETTEKQSSAKMLLVLLQRAEAFQNKLIMQADTPEEQRSMQKIMQNLSLARGCAETLNQELQGIKF